MQPAPSPSIPAQRRLTAIRVLHTKIQSLTKARGAASNSWGKQEKDALAARDELIEEAVPGAKQSRERLLELQEAHAQLKTIRGDKKRDLDERARKIAEFEGYLTEAITASVEAEQTSLPLGDTMSLAEGLALTPGALKAIRISASDLVPADGEASDPDVADLLGAITAMGLDGLSFGGDPEPEPAANDGEASDGEAAEDAQPGDEDIAF
jgi:hypothetical protein